MSQVLVPAAVLAGIEAARQDGRHNMLDRPRVIELLIELGYDDAAWWVETHRSEYSRGIFCGFAVAGRDWGSMED